MRRLPFVAAIACGLAQALPLRAEPTQYDAAIFKLVFSVTGGRSSADVQFRESLAETILSFWTSFNASIPRNSPAVTEWLNNELDTTDMTRIGRVTATPEYALRELATLADDCLSDAQLLKRSVGQKTTYEMYAWMRITGCYGNPSAVETHLKTADLSKGLYDGPVTMAHGTLLHSFITGRIANALIDQGD